MRLVSSLCFAAAVLSASAVFAQNPFVGNWKLNTASAKSMEQVNVVTFTSAANGAIISSPLGEPARTYTPNGTRYPNPLGFVDICKTLNDHNLECAIVMAGVTRGRRTWRLSNDRNTLLREEVHDVPGVVSKPRLVEDYVRNTPGSGFAGSWQHTYTTEGLVMHWTPAGPNGLHMEMPELNSIIDLTFDGKEHHPAGPAGSYISMSATRTGPNSFLVVPRFVVKALPPAAAQKMLGTATPATEYRVSPDGQTLTATSHEMNGAPKALTYVRLP